MCAVYVGDQNKVAMIGESGTYANTSGTGIWLGLVQDHNAEESMGVMSLRYQGAATRNVGTFADGPIDVTGTLTTYPQDARLLGYALGSINSVSGLICSHYYSESNNGAPNAFTSGLKAPFMSLTLEDSKSTVTGQNFIRTYKGCMVDSITLSASQGEALSMDVNYIAQSVTFSSGASTAVTASTLRPFLWSDTNVMINGSGLANRYDEITAWSFSASNSIQPTHYCNGSRWISIPIPTNRDYEFTATYQANNPRSQAMFTDYLLSGTEFNMLLNIEASAGSRAIYLTLSGCKMTNLSTPGPVEGIVEQELTIVPKAVTGIEFNSTLKHSPW